MYWTKMADTERGTEILFYLGCLIHRRAICSSLKIVWWQIPLLQIIWIFPTTRKGKSEKEIHADCEWFFFFNAFQSQLHIRTWWSVISWSRAIQWCLFSPMIYNVSLFNYVMWPSMNDASFGHAKHGLLH